MSQTTFDAADDSGDDAVRAAALESHLLPLIECIYAASLDSRRWQQVAESLSQAFRGAGVSIAFYPAPGSVEPERYAAVIPAHRKSMLRQVYDHRLPWGKTVARTADQHFVSLDFLVSDDDLAQTDFYREVMAPCGLPPLNPLVHVFAIHGRDPIAAMSIFPGPQGRFKDAEIVFANRLAIHLRRAFEICSKLRGLERRHTVLAEVMDRLPNGVILLDDQGRAVDRNRAAEDALRHMRGFSIRDGRPVATDPAANERLQALIGEAIGLRGDRRGDFRSSMALNLVEGEGETSILVVSLMAPPVDSRAPETVAVLFLGTTPVTRVASIDVLRTLYGLTNAEAELTRLLAEGLSLEEAAERREVTVNTARSQLKQVFSKTGAKRQSDVVRLVLEGVAMVRID